jgi:hypothetical protein
VESGFNDQLAAARALPGHVLVMAARVQPLWRVIKNYNNDDKDLLVLL